MDHELLVVFYFVSTVLDGVTVNVAECAVALVIVVCDSECVVSEGDMIWNLVSW